MKALYKKLKTSGHFSDFWHKASSHRKSKKIRAKLERQKLKTELEQ